jgi:hypothetical protein
MVIGRLSTIECNVPKTQYVKRLETRILCHFQKIIFVTAVDP